MLKKITVAVQDKKMKTSPKINIYKVNLVRPSALVMESVLVSFLVVCSKFRETSQRMWSKPQANFPLEHRRSLTVFTENTSKRIEVDQLRVQLARRPVTVRQASNVYQA